MKRVLVLVEGQTEERFIKDILAPAFLPAQVYLTPILLVTKRVKDGPNFKGGVTNFERFRSDLTRLLHQAGDALVTTLLDYYGLPGDFPGMADRPRDRSIKRVEHVEKAIGAFFGNPRHFLPFLALHEFEAWLFSSVDGLHRALLQPSLQGPLAEIRGSFASPEEINDGPETAPSKRILKLYPAYRKTVDGPRALAQIGLDTIRRECPHFDGWVRRLEELAAA